MFKGLIKVVDLEIVLLNNFLSSYHFWWLTFLLNYYLLDCKFNYLTYFVSLILDFECILDIWVPNEVTNFKKYIHFSWFVINNLVFGNTRSLYEQLNCFLFLVIYYINYWRKFYQIRLVYWSREELPHRRSGFDPDRVSLLLFCLILKKLYCLLIYIQLDFQSF